MLYIPQWMNIPNLASRNHSRLIRFSCEGTYFSWAEQNTTINNKSVVMNVFFMLRIRLNFHEGNKCEENDQMFNK